MGNALKIAIIGATGRMGRALEKAITENPDFILTEKVSSNKGSLIKAFETTDVVLDFSVPALTRQLLTTATKTKTPLLIGTTGHNEDLKKDIKEAGKNGTILLVPNTSLGVALLRQRVIETARALPPDTPVRIEDIHHSGKKDAPSGTALMLKEALEKTWACTLSDQIIRSERIGSVPGTHRVLFNLEDETLAFEHIAKDRMIFARGALKAAQWLTRAKPGFYTMEDVLGSLTCR